MNDPSGARMKVSLTALTMAECFWNVNKQDLLLFIDNIFRFVQARLEVFAYLWKVVRKYKYIYVNAKFF